MALAAAEKTSNMGVLDIYRKRRLILILWLVEAGILAAIGSSVIFPTGWLTVAVLLVSGSTIAIALREMYKDNLSSSVAIFLWTLTALIFSLMWLNSGLRDASILALPGVLIFSAMMGGRGLFTRLFTVIIVFVVLLGGATLMGWRPDTVVTTNAGTVFDITVVLLIIGYSVRLMARDMRSLVDQLDDENNRVLESQKTIAHLAQHDALTGLPNRLLCRDRFIQSIAHSQRSNNFVALLFLDLDNFKAVNDSLGHSAGDELLIEMSRRLQDQVRKVDSVCRFGGDEFVIVIESCGDNQDIAVVADGILKVAAKPFAIQGQEFILSVSIGIAVAPAEGDEFDQLCDRADMAMYKAKEAGRNTFRFFDAELGNQANIRFDLAKGLRRAIAGKELEIYFQPQLDLASSRIIGAEALLRWNRPGVGFIPPVKFIPVAEETGLIVDIGRWVLIEACRECKRWHKLGYTDLKVSVNLSPVQFSRPGISEMLQFVQDDIGLDLAFVELEITESLLVNDAGDTQQHLTDIHRAGAMLAIDDFGTGYSSLSYLTKFNVDVLKIDQSFIRNLFASPEDEIIVRVVIQLAKGLGIKIVAEGVEDLAALQWLQNEDCDYGQGYYWAKPMSADHFLDFISDYSARQITSA